MSKEWSFEFGAPLVKLKGKKPFEKNWPNLKLTKDNKADFEGLNVGFICGKEYTPGRFLHVLDIDPRNGGFEALKILTEEYEFDPKETLTVETGSGGHHYYYWHTEPLKKQVLMKGIDFLGEGSQVVAPGSIHPDTGKEYIVIENDIMPIPRGLLDKILETQENFFEGRLLVREVKEMPEGGSSESGLAGRDDYIIRLMRSYVGQGLTFDEALPAILIVNERRCKPPLPRELVEKKLKATYEKFAANKKSTALEPKTVKRDFENRIESYLAQDDFDYYEMSDGAIKSLLWQARESAERSYDEWNLAASLAIVSAASQGSYFYPDSTRTSLNLYQWLAGPSGCGKDFYKRFVTDYVSAIHEKLLSPKFGSAYGLRASLYAMNSRISIIDEMQDEMSRLGSQKGSYLFQILTDMKELFNSGQAYHGTVIKDRFYRTVNQPRYSVFCLSVPEGVKNLLNGDHIGGGLASRFLFFPISAIPEQKNGKPLEVKPDVLSLLSTIFKSGWSPNFEKNDHDELLKLYGGSGIGPRAKSAPEHDPQTLSHLGLIVSAEALEIFEAYQDTVKGLYREIFNSNIDDNASPAPTIERSAMFAKKISALHALGCAREDITEDDMRFGVGVSKMITAKFVRFMQSNTSVTKVDENRNKVMNALAHLLKKNTNIERISYRDLMPYTKLKGDDYKATLVDLNDMGLIAIYQGDERLFSVSLKRWPEGLTFALL